MKPCSYESIYTGFDANWCASQIHLQLSSFSSPKDYNSMRDLTSWNNTKLPHLYDDEFQNWANRKCKANLLDDFHPPQWPCPDSKDTNWYIYVDCIDICTICTIFYTNTHICIFVFSSWPGHLANLSIVQARPAKAARANHFAMETQDRQSKPVSTSSCCFLFPILGFPKPSSNGSKTKVQPAFRLWESGCPLIQLRR